jgi:hypothetical protein
LREPDKALDDLLTMGRALEMADAQSLTMERDSVNKVHTTQCPQPHKPRGCNENIRHTTIMTRENNKNVHVVTVVDSFHIRLNARIKARHVIFARNIIIVAKCVGQDLNVKMFRK